MVADHPLAQPWPLQLNLSEQALSRSALSSSKLQLFFAADQVPSQARDEETWPAHLRRMLGKGGKAGSCRRFPSRSDLCLGFGQERPHRIGFSKPYLRVPRGNLVHVDVSCRNPIRVDVSGLNVDTDSISRNVTCGFVREFQSMWTFPAKTSTQNRFAPALPAVFLGSSILCRRFPAKSRFCRGLPSVISARLGGTIQGVPAKNGCIQRLGCSYGRYQEGEGALRPLPLPCG